MKNSPAYSAVWLFLIWIAIGGALMFLLLVPQAEDLWKYYRGWEYLHSIGEEFQYPSIGYSFTDNYLHPNGRVCDAVVEILYEYIPRWAIALVWLATFTGIFAICIRLSTAFSPSNNKPLLTALFGIIFLLTFPFNSPILLVSYFLPYVVGTLIILYTLYCFLKLDKNTLSRRQLICIGLLTLLAGIWHESNAGVLLACLIAAWLTLPSKSRRQGALLICLLTIGIIFDITSPGLHERSQMSPLLINPFGWFRSRTLTGGIYLTSYVVLPLLYCLTILTLLCLRRIRCNLFPAGRSFLKSIQNLPPYAKILLICLSGVVATLELLLVVSLERVAIPGNLLAAIGFIILISHALSISVAPGRTARLLAAIPRYAVVICAMLMSLNILINLALQQRISRHHIKIHDLFTHSADGVVYYDLPPVIATNPYPWQWTRNDYTTNPYTLLFIKQNPQLDTPRTLRLVPTALRPDSILAHAPEITTTTIGTDTILTLRGHLLATRPPLLTSLVTHPDTDIPLLKEAIPSEVPFLKYNILHTPASPSRNNSNPRNNFNPTPASNSSNNSKHSKAPVITTFFYLIPIPSPFPDTPLYYLCPVTDKPADLTISSDCIIAILPSAYW